MFPSPYVLSAPAVRYQNGGAEHSANFSTVANIGWMMWVPGSVLATAWENGQDISIYWVNYH
jgi:hypothetical protein